MNSVQLLQVLGELNVSLRYSFEVLHCKAYICVWIQDRVMITPLCLELGKGKRCLAGVPDLSTIPSGPFIGSEVFQCKVNDFIPLNIDVPLFMIEAILNEFQV